jgi:formylglycine-generating enzyme required for sulfatase activity
MRNLIVIAFSMIIFGITLLLVSPCSAGETIELKESKKAEKSKETKDEKKDAITNSIGMKLKWIDPGEFMMGGKENDNEKPVHKVKLTKGFYIGVYEVTQEEYEKVMGKNPSRCKGANLPVEMVSWNDANEFCKKLSEKEGEKYRLLSEAEWEYACRAGSKTEYYWGDSFDEKYAWCGDNSKQKGKTHPVGTREPNKWGLYDMSGNVWEWCQDWYESGYPTNEQVDPEGPASSEKNFRVARGGSWEDLALFRLHRSAYRNGGTPSKVFSSFGFRVVRASEK